MKENKQLLETLKAGLGNGLKAQRKNIDRIDTIDIKGIQYGSDSVNNILVIFTHNNGHYLRGYLYELKPILFPLSMLTKPIIIEGYNDGKEFVPLEELKKYEDNTNDWDWLCHIENFSESAKKIMEVDWQSAPVRLFDVMIKWHFNLYELDETDFINAHESKAYEPK